MFKQGDCVLYPSAAWPGCGGYGTVEYYDKFVMMYQVRKEDGMTEWFLESSLRPAKEGKMFVTGDEVQVVLGGTRLVGIIDQRSYSGTMFRVELEDGKKIWIDRDDMGFASLKISPEESRRIRDRTFARMVGHVKPEEQNLCWPPHVPVIMPEISAAALERIKKRVFEGIAELERTRRRELWEKHKDDIVVLEVFQRPPYTCVIVGIVAGVRSGPLGMGFAKCIPTDKWSDQTGKDIAKGRAIAHLLDKMVEQCRG